MSMDLISICENQSSNANDEDYYFAKGLVNACLLPMVMRAAIKLNVFEIMNKASKTPLSSSHIASQLPNNKNPNAQLVLDRMLCFLASHSVLTCTTATNKKVNDSRSNVDGAIEVERLYGLTPACKYFIKNEDGASLTASLLASTDKMLLEPCYYLDEVVLEPDFSVDEKVYGMNAYEYFAKNPELNELCNTTMSHETSITMKRILDKYKGFDGLKVVVDVGGGIGTNINFIVSKYPTIKGINFDSPHVVETAPSYPGVEHVGGDMFVSVPKADAIFMKWILHNWKDEQCLILLKKCHEALPKGGKVIVIEGLLPEVPKPDDATRDMCALDIIMTMSFGAKERTEKEFEDLAKESGFASIRLQPEIPDLVFLTCLPSSFNSPNDPLLQLRQLHSLFPQLH
ncbi:hypothetical protein Syun_021989 [Stephania yunnanensis]|uniref:Caffeic acid O-methyltransferase n=1 Tax=Stephania yunnanensis TaxID=152371 RepID=A0AAP0NPL5_9MAGN